MRVQAGANMIVSGCALMRSADPGTVMSQMRQAVIKVMQKHSHVVTGS